MAQKTGRKKKAKLRGRGGRGRSVELRWFYRQSTALAERNLAVYWRPMGLDRCSSRGDSTSEVSLVLNGWGCGRTAVSFDSRLRKVKGRNKGRREKWKEKRINRSETIARMQTGGLVERRERKKQGGRRTNGSPVCTVASYSSYSNQRRRGSNLSIHHSNDWTSGPQPQLQEPWNEHGKHGRSVKMTPKKQTPHGAYPLIHVLFKQKR